VTSIPPHKTLPALGSVSRLIKRSNVDFPAPERPITPTNWPAGMSSETLSTARARSNTLVSASVTSSGPLPAIFLAAPFYRGAFGINEERDS